MSWTTLRPLRDYGVLEFKICIPFIGERIGCHLGTSPQFHPEWGLLCRSRDEGRETARGWFDQNFEHVGCRSTVDLAEMFL